MGKASPVKLILIFKLIILCLACCMLPAKYEGSIQQTQQEGIIIYKDGVQDLILKVDPKITGKTKLDNFCWLITVPNEPEKYDVLDEAIFESFFDLKTKYLVKPKRESRGIGCSEKSSMEKVSKAYEGVELGKYTEVGDYAIQPVRGIGEHAFTGLNKWLGDNGFPTEPQEHMQYFIDEKFTFLCIKIKPDTEGESEVITPQLKPLHMTFKSKEPYYPMKYSSQQGDFSVNIYTVTDKPIDFIVSKSVLEKIDWRNRNLFKNKNLAGKALPDNIKKIVNEKQKYLYFNNFNCLQPNTNKKINSWTEDVFFSLNNSHYPNKANMMTVRKISWIRTGFLALGITLFFIIAARKWKN
ncbi:MAG: DUF2330 domain-containing protein [Lentisphaeraceae bacterium]|nr:DUF2330 domain-containing protein [Lentisphaeraceae bacterium]